MSGRMTKAENSRVAQSNEPSADRIAADLAITSPGAGNERASANLGGGDTSAVAPNFSATVVIDTVSDKGSYADHIRDTACMGATL